MDQTQHYRAPSEEDEMEMTRRSLKPKKSVSFADVVAIDAETGKEYQSFASLLENHPFFSVLLPYLDDDNDDSSFFWKRASRTRKAPSFPQNVKRNKKSKPCKNLFLRGWSKLNYRLHQNNKKTMDDGSVQQQQQGTAVMAQ